MKQIHVMIYPHQDRLLVEIAKRLGLGTKVLVFHRAMKIYMETHSILSDLTWHEPPLKVGSPSKQPPITKTKPFSILLTEEQKYVMGMIAHRMNLESRSAVFHRAIIYLIGSNEKLAGMDWGSKPAIGGNRGGAQAQAAQKARAREALDHVK